ncbi:MAG: hypothetical protein OQL08_12550 [Gammaproteobacteria bacterium]|nr:hypothetical protein [Gammaproteobacteria bacterium]
MKMKKWLTGAAAAIIVTTASAAEDFSAYSIEELQQKRSEVRNMSEAERTAFRQEMQRRMATMSDAERAQMRQGAGAGKGPGGGHGMQQ